MPKFVPIRFNSRTGDVTTNVSLVALWYTLKYLLWGCLVVLFGWTVIKMNGIENIPAEYVIPVAITIAVTALFLDIFYYLISFQNRTSKVLDEQSKAVEEGKEPDKIELKRIENFHYIYKVALIISIPAVACGAFALFATVVGDFVTFDSLLKVCVYACGTTVVAFLLIECLLIHSVANGAFKKWFVDPLREEILATATQVATVVTEVVKSKEDEAKDKLYDAVSFIMNGNGNKKE